MNIHLNSFRSQVSNNTNENLRHLSSEDGMDGESLSAFDKALQGKKLSSYEKTVLIVFGLAFLIVGIFLFRVAYVAQSENQMISHTVSKYESSQISLEHDDDSLVEKRVVRVKPVIQYGWSVVFTYTGVYLLSVLLMKPFIIAFMSGLWGVLLTSVFIFGYWDHQMPIQIKVILIIFFLISLGICALSFSLVKNIKHEIIINKK